MKRRTSARFDLDFARLPDEVKKRADKQLELLVLDLRYPSLHAKKYDESRGIWQARVTDDWRVYFRIVGDTYYLLSIIRHPK